MLLKLLKFIINSNIFLAFAAAGITLATQIQLGFQPKIDALVAMVFFATISDYNIHRFLASRSIPEAAHIEKNSWAADNQPVLKTVIFLSFGLLVSTLFFVRLQTLFLTGLLAVLALLYSVSYLKDRWNGYWHKRIPGVKTILLVFTWTATTAFLVGWNKENKPDFAEMLLVCIERFAFILAIAIPFDIRDMEIDKKSGINTIPIAFGVARAYQISNISLCIALCISIFHYSGINMLFTLTAFILSIGFTLISINSKKLRSLPYYHNAILDGCLLLHGILIFGSYYLQT